MDPYPFVMDNPPSPPPFSPFSALPFPPASPRVPPFSSPCVDEGAGGDAAAASVPHAAGLFADWTAAVQPGGLGAAAAPAPAPATATAATAAAGAPLPSPAAPTSVEEVLELLAADGRPSAAVEAANGVPSAAEAATDAPSAAAAAVEAASVTPSTAASASTTASTGASSSAGLAEEIAVEALPSLPSTPLLVEALGDALGSAGSPPVDGGSTAAAAGGTPPSGATSADAASAPAPGGSKAAKRQRTPLQSPPSGGSSSGSGSPPPDTSRTRWIPHIMLASAGINGGPTNMALRPSVPLIRPHPLRVRLEELLPDALAWLFPAPLFGDTRDRRPELSPFSANAFHSAFFRERTTIALGPPGMSAAATAAAAAAAAVGMPPLVCAASFVGITDRVLSDGTILGCMVNEWTFRLSSRPYPGLPTYTAKMTRVAVHPSWGLLLVTPFDDPDVLCVEALSADDHGGVLRQQHILRRGGGALGDTPALFSTHVVHLARATNPPPGAAVSGASTDSAGSRMSSCERLVDDLISGHYVGAVTDGMAGLRIGDGPSEGGCSVGPGEGGGGGGGEGRDLVLASSASPLAPAPPRLSSPVPFSFFFGHTSYATQLRLRSLALQIAVVGVPAPRTPTLCLSPPPRWGEATSGDGGRLGTASVATVLCACGWEACASTLARLAALPDGGEDRELDRPAAATAAATDAGPAAAAGGTGAPGPPPTSTCKTCGAPTRSAVPPPKKRRRRRPSSPLDEAAWARVLRNRESARASNERRRLARAAARAAEAAAAQGDACADGRGLGEGVSQRSVA